MGYRGQGAENGVHHGLDCSKRQALCDTQQWGRTGVLPRAQSIQRGLKLIPLFLMSSFKQSLIKGQGRGQMDPDKTPIGAGGPLNTSESTLTGWK